MTKSVLITGTSSGYGKATAQLFLDRGWNVVATMRRPNHAIFRGPADRLRVLPLDITDPDSISKAITGGIAAFGAIDVLVNNAGIGLMSAFEFTPESVLREVFETNTFGLMSVCRAVIPHMREQGKGVIINVTSSAGIAPMPMVAIYTASKCAVEGFSEALSYEMGLLGIRVRLVEPGLAPTTNFAPNGAGRMQGLMPPPYDAFAQAYMAKMQNYPTAYTTEQETAEAVFSAATDDVDRLRYPVGKEPERLVMVWGREAEAAGGDRAPLAVSDLLDLRAQSRSFADIEAFTGNMFNYTGSELPEQALAGVVTAKFFSVLGVLPSLGRTFSPDEERPGAQRVVLLSDGFWRKYFAADPQVVGRAINLSGQSYNVIGVMPANLEGFSKIELWVALQLQQPTRRGPHSLLGVARLKSDVGLDQARAEVMNSIKSSFTSRLSFNIVPVNEVLVGDVRPALLMLLGTVTLVTLIAVVNVTNLMLARSAARVKEISIRAALGAGRVRIIRQLLTESLLLALIGGLLGLLFASLGVGLLLKIAPEDIPRLDQVGIDGRMLGWTALLSLLTSVLFGLAPAWQSSRLSPNEALKEGGRSVTESRNMRRGRDLLVISELALAVMLLIGAGLLVKSFWRLQRVDSGVNTERVLTMQLTLLGQRYADRGKIDAFYSSLLERIQALPGVSAAAMSNSLPPDRPNFADVIKVEGRPAGQNQTP